MAKKHNAPPFVMVRRDMMRDPNWRQLSRPAKIIWIYMRAKFNYKTLGQVSLAYSEVQDMMSSKTISKAFKELEREGFIKKTKNGGLYGGVCRYIFTGPYKDYYYRSKRY